MKKFLLLSTMFCGMYLHCSEEIFNDNYGEPSDEEIQRVEDNGIREDKDWVEDDDIFRFENLRRQRCIKIFKGILVGATGVMLSLLFLPVIQKADLLGFVNNGMNGAFGWLPSIWHANRVEKKYMDPAEMCNYCGQYITMRDSCLADEPLTINDLKVLGKRNPLLAYINDGNTASDDPRTVLNNANNFCSDCGINAPAEDNNSDKKGLCSDIKNELNAARTKELDELINNLLMAAGEQLLHEE